MTPRNAPLPPNLAAFTVELRLLVSLGYDPTSAARAIARVNASEARERAKRGA